MKISTRETYFSYENCSSAVFRAEIAMIKEIPPMIVLMVSTILASVAMGVALAYGCCSALFAIAKMRVRAQHPAPLRIQAKSANP